jgi:hypothetical protein
MVFLGADERSALFDRKGENFEPRQRLRLTRAVASFKAFHGVPIHTHQTVMYTSNQRRPVICM